MKTNLKMCESWMFCTVALGIGLVTGAHDSYLVCSAEQSDSLTHECRGRARQESCALLSDHANCTNSAAQASSAIPWSQLGAKAGAGYKGDGLTVIPTAEGAQLSCVFQRLEGEATREGLWLTSTVTNSANERFRVAAM